MARSSKKQERLQRIDRLIRELQNCSDPLRIAQLGTIEHDWLFDNYAASSAGTFISGEYLPAIDKAFEPSEGDDLLAHECWQKVNGVLVKRHLVSQTLKPSISEWEERNKPFKESTVDRINSPNVTNSRSPVTENSPTTETKSIINQPIMQQTNTVTENLSLTDNTVTDNGRSGTQLSDRFNVSRPTIGRNRKKGVEHFAAWSKKSDPNGIAWKFLKRGKLTDSQHIVDIYLPIANDDPILSQLDKINENKPSVVVNDPQPVQAVPKSKKSSQPQASKLQLSKDKQERFQSLCSNLGLIGNFEQQFDQLLNWAEEKLTADRSLPSESNSTNNEQLLAKAIETIAQFSENLNNTLVPFTEELKIFNQQHHPAPNQEIDRPQSANETTESIQETEIQPPATPVEDPIAPSIENEPDLNNQPTPTTDNHDRLSKLNGSDLSATIDALNLAISVKQSAIAKEKKKRSRKDDRTIDLWLQEISAIKRSIELLE